MNIAKKFIKDEKGFEVFEKLGLTQGGVILALGVVAVAVMAMGGFWQGIGSDYFADGGQFEKLDPTITGTEWGL